MTKNSYFGVSQSQAPQKSHKCMLMYVDVCCSCRSSPRIIPGIILHFLTYPENNYINIYIHVYIYIYVYINALAYPFFSQSL